MQNTHFQIDHTLVTYLVTVWITYYLKQSVSAVYNGIAVNDHRLYIYTQT